MCLHSVRKYMILKYLENCRLQKGIYMNNTSETSLQFHKIATRKEAEDFVYASYLRAASHQDYAAKDARKRHPELTRSLLWQKSVTPCIVVTGSKGKGSISNMISRILQTRFSVGLMTSPHITDFRERFRVNDTMISESDFCRLMTEIQPEILNIASDLPESVCISPMGIQADLALAYFSEKHTDFNVLECGKGAKYDDVNNVRHDYAVINRIFLEHTRELGDTLTAIAEDKSHVITGEQKCVYFAEQEPEVLEVLQRRAETLHIPYKIYGRDFHAENIRYTCFGMQFDVEIGDNIYADLQIPLLGEHQAKNCALALAVCVDVLSDLRRESAVFSLPDIRKNLSLLHWPGRMEVLRSKPFVLLDACINATSCENVKEVLRHLGVWNCTVIVGIPEDKDYAGVVRSMKGMANRIILTRSGNPHYHFSQKQQETLAEEDIGTIWTDSVKQALTLAGSCPDPIVILGTTSVISEVEQIFQQS